MSMISLSGKMCKTFYNSVTSEKRMSVDRDGESNFVDNFNVSTFRLSDQLYFELK